MSSRSKSAIRQCTLLLGVVLILVSACAGQRVCRMSPEAKAYVAEVISVLQEKSLRKYEIDWPAFKDSVFYKARNSKTIEDTYPAITYAVKLLGDHHSYFFSRVSAKKEEKPLPVFLDEVVPADIGYVRLSFCLGGAPQVARYIQDITDQLDRQNSSALKGWIIDLRDNFGGNMWPMMVAVGPLLDAGTQGYFVDPDNRYSSWYYEQGKAYIDSMLMEENAHPIVLYGRSRIAVLINSKTASSGEAMAVLFKGYKNARLFGVPTFGVSTGCETVALSDGSRINLATTVFADRDKVSYGGPVLPDVRCADTGSVAEAIRWIRR